MAWQTPKTDWSTADGVRDTDFNRIEGNTLALYEETARRSYTIYVSASVGNDDSNDGTTSRPYKTIGKALSMLPRNFNGYPCTVHIAPGTYNETVTVNSAFRDMVKFVSSAFSSAVTIQQIIVENGGALELADMTLTVSGGIVVRKNASLISTATLKNVGRGAALSVSFNSMAQVFDLEIGSVATYGIEANSNSSVSVSSIKGTATSYALYASGGGVIAYTTNSATGAIYTASGGRIYTGSQS